MDLSTLTLAGLRADLQERGLETKGSKAMLVERLLAALQEEEEEAADKSEAGNTTSLDIKEEEIEIKEEIFEGKQDLETEVSGSTMRGGEKRVSSSSCSSKTKKQCPEVDQVWIKKVACLPAKMDVRTQSRSSLVLSHSANPIEWTRSSTLHFIEVLKQHPSIWNVKSKGYKIRSIRNGSLDTMKIELSKIMNCEVNVVDILKKVHTLKSQFQRELSTMKAMQKSAAITGDVYLPKLWCFEELQFLTEGDIRQASTSNSEEGEAFQQESEVAYQAGVEEVFDVTSMCAPSPAGKSQTPAPAPNPTQASPVKPLPSPSPSCSSGYGRPPKKKKQIDQIDNAIALAVDKLSSLSSHNTPDPCMDFAKVVNNELKSMKDLQRKFAKKLINEVLFMGNMEFLSGDHKVLKVQFSD